jgi:hypothetical protein
VGELDTLGRVVAEQHTILRIQVGSGLHGIAVGGNDDRDELGIAIEPPWLALSARRWEHWVYRTQPEGAPSGAGDLDLTVYSMWKWCKLAAGGNPTVILPLFAPDDEVVELTEEGAELRARPQLFVSRTAGRRYLGYLQSQRERLVGRRGQMRVNRPELVAEHGYDVKYAAHALRLGYQGVELLSTGRLTLPVPEPQRSRLIDVRLGKVPLEDALEELVELEAQLVRLTTEADLPDKTDLAEINSVVAKLYLDYWARTGQLVGV